MCVCESLAVECGLEVGGADRVDHLWMAFIGRAESGDLASRNQDTSKARGRETHCKIARVEVHVGLLG